MADDQEDSGTHDGIDERVSRLETGQETLTEKVDKILGIVSGGQGEESAHPEEPSGGTNIAHEIRAQLDARDAAAAASAAEQGRTDRLAAAEAKIAELAEKPPAPMPRRVERIMGWC